MQHDNEHIHASMNMLMVMLLLLFFFCFDRTIIYVSILYCLGNILMTLTAIPFDGNYYMSVYFININIESIQSIRNNIRL